jgi:hypothetical protein
VSGSLLTGAWRRAAVALWFPVLFAIALPVAFQVAFHTPTPHGVTVAVAGDSTRATRVRAELGSAGLGEIDVRPVVSRATAMSEVRKRQVAAAIVASGGRTTLYVARAASVTRANYLQGVLARVGRDQRQPVPGLDRPRAARLR